MSNFKVVNGVTYKLVYCRSIRRNGRIIYPKRSKCFRFWVQA